MLEAPEEPAAPEASASDGSSGGAGSTSGCSARVKVIEVPSRVMVSVSPSSV
jgi:hypothetical protein